MLAASITLLSGMGLFAQTFLIAGVSKPLQADSRLHHCTSSLPMHLLRRVNFGSILQSICLVFETVLRTYSHRQLDSQGIAEAPIEAEGAVSEG